MPLQLSPITVSCHLFVVSTTERARFALAREDFCKVVNLRAAIPICDGSR